jgi:hypothetical protein
MSCGGLLTPVMMIAGSGLLQNTGLGINSALSSNLSSFNNLPITSQFSNVVTSASGSLSGGVLNSLRTMGQDFTALTNAIPSSLSSALSTIAPGGVANGGLTGLTDTFSNAIMGNGDNGFFTQIYNAASGFASEANQFLSSTFNSIGDTFGQITGGMNDLITGGFNQVSTGLRDLGVDLGQLGNMLDLNNLPSLGDPATLVARIGQLSGGEIPGLNQVLSAAGVATSTINSITQGIDQLNPATQKLLYDGMTKVTGVDLQQVKTVLGVSSQLGNINTMADLLDPKKILPNSFQTLVTPTPNGLVNIYQPLGNNVFGINTTIEKFLQDPNAEPYTGTDPIVRARLGLPPLPESGTLTA